MTAKQVMSILRKNGWELVRISGSHHIFEKEGANRTVSVPFHGNRELKYLAKRILKEADIK